MVPATISKGVAGAMVGSSKAEELNTVSAGLKEQHFRRF
jgi:hypothetical protein